MIENLQTFHFAGQQPGPHLLITAGVHGDEFESIFAVQRLVRLFETNDPRIAGLRGMLTLVPVVNEAAVLNGHRCGQDGLDLARSFPGRSDGSETEQIANLLSERIRSADHYIDLHTGGTEFTVFPLAGYVMHSDNGVLEMQREMASAFNLPFVWGTAANLEGRSLSVARDAHVPAIYCEYLGGAKCDQAGVDAYLNGCLNVMGVLAMLDRKRPLSHIEHSVEDRTPGSGHMQICNPSPITGLFEPCVSLGDHVVAGQKIGIVRHWNSLVEHRIESQKSGILIVLRTFPRVRQGESLGVIVELS